jgi:DNA-damage-inducible protein J
MEHETAPSPRSPEPRIADGKPQIVEPPHPNAKTIAAMEEARAIKAGHGKVIDTADELLQSLKSGKVAK